MYSVAESLNAAVQMLAGSSDSPRLDAELLLAKALGTSRSALITRQDDCLPAATASQYRDLIATRARGTPVAYLTGTREFWSLPLNVTPAVLVPRPETELLVECTLARAAATTTHSFLDLGTGSGAIAIAVASERPRSAVTAVDISAAALAIARGNAAAHGLAHIEWLLGSWFAPVATRRFDVIISNPPYIAADDAALAQLTAEPALALSPGPTGLEALQAIVAGARRHLNAGGRLLVEHGNEQGRDVATLFAQHGFAEIRTVDDFSKKPRVTQGTAFTQH